jgi:hypothetical protein
MERELDLNKQEGEEIGNCETDSWLLIWFQARIAISGDIGEQEMRRKMTALRACKWKSM